MANGMYDSIRSHGTGEFAGMQLYPSLRAYMDENDITNPLDIMSDMGPMSGYIIVCLLTN
jgi:hypothetical protein